MVQLVHLNRKGQEKRMGTIDANDIFSFCVKHAVMGASKCADERKNQI